MSLTDQIIDREPLESEGNSESPIERVTMSDGRVLVLKRSSPEWDWMARLTGDRGRIGQLWDQGAFDRIPSGLDHATVHVETAGDTSLIFMRDVSSTLMAADTRLDRAAITTILSAAHAFHSAFWDEHLAGLCTLEDRYRMFGPGAMSEERRRGNHHGEIISRGWEAFGELVSAEVAATVVRIADDPDPLVTELARHPWTLIHGDLRQGNLGLDGDRVVLIDWGERVGLAPPAVELAWFLGFDAHTFGVAPEDAIAVFRRLYGDRSSEAALQLALIGALVQLGGIMSLWVVSAEGEDDQARYRSHVAWWDRAVSEALEAWSPG